MLAIHSFRCHAPFPNVSAPRHIPSPSIIRTEAEAGSCRSRKTHRDLNAVVGEDEGRVGRSELGGRHREGFGVLESSWSGCEAVEIGCCREVSSRLKFPLRIILGGLPRPKESVVPTSGWCVLSPLETREGSGHVTRSNPLQPICLVIFPESTSRVCPHMVCWPRL